MLNSRIRTTLWVAAVTIVLLLIGWVAMPRIISALPGRVRQYLPSELVAQTPVPLPTPRLVADVPALNLIESTAIAPEPTHTHEPVAVEPTADGSEATATLAAATPLPAPTIQAEPDYPPSAYIDGVEIIPQKFNNCGATNLAMVLNYHDVAVDQFAIADVVRPTYEDRNVSPEELASYVVHETNLQASVVAGGNLTMLRQLLAAGLPVIIEKGLVPDDETGWMGHYLTLYGYDEANQSFYTRDSFLGPWEEDGRESYDNVQEYWRMFNNVMIVTYPSERQQEVAQILGDSLDDPSIAWERAAENARAAIRADSADLFGWFNLGTSLTHLYGLTADSEQLEQAVASFDQARLLGLPARMLWYQFAPYEAYLAAGRTEDVIALADATLSNQGGRSVEETYIYRALALRAKGDEQRAQADLLQAESLHPGNPVLLRVKASQP